MQTNVKIGDMIGMIIKFLEPKKYELMESCVTSIRETKKCIKVYAPKCFHPLDLSEIESNTNWMNENKNLILVREPVLMSEELRERMQCWCDWATDHYDELERDR